MTTRDDWREAIIEGFLCGRKVGEVKESVVVVEDLQRGVGALDFADKLIQKPRSLRLRYVREFYSHGMFEEGFSPWAEVGGKGGDGRRREEGHGRLRCDWLFYVNCYANSVLRNIGLRT
jgi:hypothetical protein